MVKDHLLTIAISSYRTSVENVVFSLSVKHSASIEKKSRTTVMVSFGDVTGIRPCPNLSSFEPALKIACGAEAILIRKEDTTQC
ncbi:hypothetical protein TNCV_3169341 [Trichonephila clavipes]|nr:hypothetical protein TNCV_3169341 [Trichonephila clavipes]